MVLEKLAFTIGGPLVDVETRRAVSRTWVKTLRGLTPVGVGLLFFLTWTLWVSSRLPAQTLQLFQIGVGVLLGFMTTGSWLVMPALLAGSFSGERVQHGLLLLLTCGVTAQEIVLGRLFGRLAACGTLLLAALPAVAFLAGLCDLSLLNVSLMLLLPLAIGFGAGGMYLALSVVSRRGRDALLAVYLIDALILSVPLFADFWDPAVDQWLGVLSPFRLIILLVEGGGRADGLLTIGLWLAIGAAGVRFAAWRLRPNATGAMSRGSQGHQRRPALVPSVGERPMLWKELHIERMRMVNHVARWLGIVLIGVYLLGHFWLGGALLVERISEDRAWQIASGWQIRAVTYATFARASNTLLAWVLELAIGLRAASTISLERERNTWDLLLTSTLTGSEIIYAKLVGSLRALRAFALIIVVGWVLPVAAGLTEAPYPYGLSVMEVSRMDSVDRRRLHLYGRLWPGNVIGQ